VANSLSRKPCRLPYLMKEMVEPDSRNSVTQKNCSFIFRVVKLKVNREIIFHITCFDLIKKLRRDAFCVADN